MPPIVIAIAVRFIPKIPLFVKQLKARFQAVFDTVICGVTCLNVMIFVLEEDNKLRSMLPLPMTHRFVTFTHGFSSGITQWTFSGRGTTVRNYMLLCMYERYEIICTL